MEARALQAGPPEGQPFWPTATDTSPARKRAAGGGAAAIEQGAAGAAFRPGAGPLAAAPGLSRSQQGAA
eukprot:6962051-Pyramimonas_sp.AAC.1